MLPKYLKIAWNVLHVLEKKEFIKTEEVVHRLKTRYMMKVTKSYVAKVIADMSFSELLDTKKGIGVRRSSTRHIIDFIDLCTGMDIEIERGFVSPSDKLGLRLFDLLRNITVKNTTKTGE